MSTPTGQPAIPFRSYQIQRDNSRVDVPMELTTLSSQERRHVVWIGTEQYVVDPDTASALLVHLLTQVDVRGRLQEQLGG
jgi:hypothetical protein